MPNQQFGQSRQRIRNVRQVYTHDRRQKRINGQQENQTREPSCCMTDNVRDVGACAERLHLGQDAGNSLK